VRFRVRECVAGRQTLIYTAHAGIFTGPTRQSHSRVHTSFEDPAVSWRSEQHGRCFSDPSLSVRAAKTTLKARLLIGVPRARDGSAGELQSTTAGGIVRQTTIPDPPMIRDALTRDVVPQSSPCSSCSSPFRLAARQERRLPHRRLDAYVPRAWSGVTSNLGGRDPLPQPGRSAGGSRQSGWVYAWRMGASIAPPG